MVMRFVGGMLNLFSHCGFLTFVIGC